jgi:NADP-dependent 3-hydroxy acid dehydrogenase YdfG
MGKTALITGASSRNPSLTRQRLFTAETRRRREINFLQLSGGVSSRTGWVKSKSHRLPSFCGRRHPSGSCSEPAKPSFLITSASQRLGVDKFIGGLRSSGIGYALAKCFAADGANLVLVARDVTRLNQVAGELQSAFKVSAKVIPADLSLAVAPAEIHRESERASLTIDYLVNNAGFGTLGAFVDTDLQTELDMMQVNMVSLVHLTKLYLRGMHSRGSGGILNVASTAAFQPGPLMSMYYAGKAFVLSFTEAIADELRSAGAGAAQNGQPSVHHRTRTTLPRNACISNGGAASPSRSSPRLKSAAKTG